MSLPIQSPLGTPKSPRVVTTGARRDDRSAVLSLKTVHEGVGIVALVGDDDGAGEVVEERFGHRDVGDLALGQRERDGRARRVDDRVDFRSEATTRSANLFGAPPLTPAASW